MSHAISILALSWRDIKSKAHGGAEVLTHELLKYAVASGFRIVHFSPLEEGLENHEVIDGVIYRRVGRVSNIIQNARKYYKKNENQIDFVIDQCNTFRFFTKFWVPREKRVFFIHQLTREIWDINMRFPVSKIGKMVETPMLCLNRNDVATITVSESTKEDLVKVGFKEERIHLIYNGLEDSMRDLDVDFEKKKGLEFIYVGRYSKYKGINTAIEALGIVKRKYPEAKLWLVGKKDEEYLSKELKPLCSSLGLSIGDAEDSDVVTWGFVSEEKKHELQGNARALIFPSVREGWGIIINEAGALGTPSITYDAPGTRDAVNFGKAGYMCHEKTAESVAKKMLRTIENRNEYTTVRKASYEYANQFTYEKSGKEFVELFRRI